MLNDTIYREFKNQPFEREYNGSEKFSQFRDALMMNEIMKCGKDILGSIGVDLQGYEEDDDVIEFTGKDYSYDQYNHSLQALTKKKYAPQHQKYIYEYDYGKHPTSQNSSPYKSHFYDDCQHPVEEISFTLSNEENSNRQSDSHHDFSEQTAKNQRHIQWKENLIQRQKTEDKLQYGIYHRKNGDFQLFVNQNVGKWKKPIKQQTDSSYQPKDMLYKKTFDLSTKKNQFSQSNKNKKSILENEGKLKNNQPSSVTKNQYFTGKIQYQTPQKTIKKPLNVPLSQQITKKIYGRLKTQVEGHNFLQECQRKEIKSKDQSVQMWTNFINRSEKWTEGKKANLLEKQMNYLYENQPRSKQKSREVSNQSYSCYGAVKVKKQSFSTQGQSFIAVNEQKFTPQRTFKIQSSNQSPLKRQSSVQNCINNLKTQTELLKVKLLSPLKKQIDNNEEINRYKHFNELQSQKSIKNLRFKESYEEKRFVRDPVGLGYVKSVYGKCIGEQSFK